MANKPLGVTVKETVDRVYDLLIQHPDGCEFSAKSLGGNKRRVVAILCQRGIVEKTRFYTKNGMRYKYKWAVASKPTKVLYGSITQEMRDRQKQWNKTFAEKKRAEKKRAEKKDEEYSANVTPEKIIEAEQKICDALESYPMKRDPLEIYGIDELWAEIKRRGCFIEDNHLTLVKKVVFD